jgi:hypothetical protein
MDRQGQGHHDARHTGPGRRQQCGLGRTEDQRSAGRRARGRADQPGLPPGATHMLRDLLGPMRWLGAAKGSDLSEALGGMPGDAGWLLELPRNGGTICITVSRRLGTRNDETRVVLFQELRGYGGLTWCLRADTPEGLERVRTEVQSLLTHGACVVTGPRSDRPPP